MTRLIAAVSVLFATGVIGAVPAWADGTAGVVENPGDMAAAVGSGVLDGAIVGFTATGPNDPAAAAAVIAACRRAGADQCTSDEVTNDRLCIVNVDSAATGVVAGGAGPTVEAARQDAFNRAATNNTPLDPGAPTLAMSCP
ncbi:MAG: hypothetical protein P4L86_01510 [Mycobacterium sp.]|nr:hypothetical protein [Mycobacterium sp.]